MKTILTFLIIFLPQLSMAELSDCGEYEVRGIVRAKKTSYEIIVNEKTMSEINISLPLSEQLKLLPYVDRPMSANLVLIKKFDGTKGSADSVISVKNRIPDPLKPGDTGLSLVKPLKCIKD